MKLQWLIVVIALIVILYTGKDVVSATLGLQTVLNRNKAIGVHPDLQLALDEWRGSFAIKVTSGIRTDAEQARLYAQGRTSPGSIVTYAATASETAHGRGAAIDVAPAPNGLALYGADAEPLYREMAAHFKSYGLLWGGDWTRLVDLPHFEIANWRTLPFPVPDYDIAYQRKVSEA